jgi:Cu/Zn superoxide dismutase
MVYGAIVPKFTQTEQQLWETQTEFLLSSQIKYGFHCVHFHENCPCATAVCQDFL